MKTIIKTLIAGLALAFSMSVFAAKQPDNISGFATEEACITAASAGKAKGYVPVESRKAGAGYKKTTMAAAGYVNGACVQGLTVFVSSAWVYLPATFAIGQKDESIVMWDCNNPINTISVMPINQQINRPASQLNFSSEPQVCTASKEKCEQKTWCDENNGWVLSKDDKGNTVHKCKVPGDIWIVDQEDQMVFNKNTKVSGHVSTEFTGWTGSNTINVPPAPALDVNLGRAAAPKVSGTKCSFDCVARATATDVVGFQDIPSTEKQCEIRWKATFGGEQGRILLDNFAGKIRLASVIPKASHPAVVVVSPWAHVRDCNVDQAMVKKNWDLVVEKLKLPKCDPVDQAKKP